ncbi:MAG: hypothetical protein PHU25_06630 [Deltaproteobacteria bacterium]|nr:hypothetical protein [Deltaproteobacteria bacterium]
MVDRKKQSGSSGKKIARREEPGTKAAEPQGKTRPEPETEPEGPPIRQRVREEGAGFGVIKVVCGIVIVIIIGAGILGRLAGSDQSDRGDKIEGARCGATPECGKGLLCFAYKDEESRCMKTCSPQKPCDTGYTCTSSMERVGRKSTRVRAVCVNNARLK